MSAGNVWMNAFLPDKKVELVKKITEKTKQGKISWQRTPQGVAAHLPGRLRMNFVETPGVLSFIGNQPRWVIFAVRDEAGNEILKAENRGSAVPGSETPVGGLVTVLTGIGGDPLASAVSELHSLVGTKAKGEIEKAIDQLDTL